MNPTQKKKQQTIHVWTLAQAQAALPYISSVMKSLREERIQALQAHLSAERVAARGGHLSREKIIARDDLSKESQAAEKRFFESYEELQKYDIYCIDPVQGTALIPFVHESQLAWFIFDLFAESGPVQSWRYHTDSPETKRPLVDMEKPVVV